MSQRVKVWDLPTRIFHWSLVALTLAALFTGFESAIEQGIRHLAMTYPQEEFKFLLGGLESLEHDWMKTHGRLGLAITALIIFRLIWGLIGSTYARFIQFIPGPKRVLAYLNGQWHGLGHNPLGAFSVLGLLALMSFQLASGLIADDSISFTGPLKDLVSQRASDFFTGLHQKNIWLIIGLVSLHFGSIVFYRVVKKTDLVTPMITGTKTIDDPVAMPAQGGGWQPFLIALALTAALTWVASGGLNPPPPPPPPQSTPAW